MTGPDTYEVKRLDEMQHAYGGALARVRAELGITAFGVQSSICHRAPVCSPPTTTTATTGRKSSTSC